MEDFSHPSFFLQNRKIKFKKGQMEEDNTGTLLAHETPIDLLFDQFSNFMMPKVNKPHTSLETLIILCKLA